MSFDGRTAVVTGGGIGFGRAFARALVAEGASVALADIDIDMAERTAAELVSAGGQAIAVRCDVADEEQVDAAVAVTADQFGGIDILINNAGRHLTKYNQPFGVLSRNEIRGLFDVNVIGVINATLACRDSMRDRGGGVVLNIFVDGRLPQCHPVRGVQTRGPRADRRVRDRAGAGPRIRVNGIAPGLMNTENALADLPRPLIDEFVQERQLVHRLGTMRDVVSAMLFLCSDEASFITGETLKVSGGYPLNF